MCHRPTILVFVFVFNAFLAVDYVPKDVRYVDCDGVERFMAGNTFSRERSI